MTPKQAYIHSRDVVKERWAEGENIIKNDPRWSYSYARNVIKGKLPENMHNAMLCHGNHPIYNRLTKKEILK